MSEITHLQGTVGPADEGQTAAGQSHAVRTSRAAAFLNAPVSASFQEAVLRGNCFTVASQSGVTSQAGLSVTTPVLTLANPSGSGVNVVVWFAGATFTVVFATVGAVWVAVGDDTTDTAVTGTLSTITKNCKIGTSNNPKAKVLLAATLPAAPVAISLLGAGLTGAVNLFPQMQTLGRWFNGGIILTPNTNLSIQTGVASGASGTFCEYVWEEVSV